MNQTLLDNPAEFEERIVEAIRDGYTSLSAIQLHLNGNRRRSGIGVIQERDLDRRLQALRRRGRITFTGTSRRSSWALTQESAQ